MTELPESGVIAAAVATGGGGLFMALRMWRAVRQELGASVNEKQQEAFQARTLTRAQDLEKKLEDLQTKFVEQSITLGVAKGESGALRLQLDEMLKNKDYWRGRALDLEKTTAELDKAVDMLTVHLANAQIRLSIAKGDLDPKTAVVGAVGELPEVAKARLAAACRTAE